MPSLQKEFCLHFSTRSPPIHLLILVTLHPSISNTPPKNETPPSCFIHPLSVFTPPPVPVFHSGGLCLFSPLSLSVCLVCCFFFLYKKAILSCFSASVSLSVCLCPCGRLPGCLAAGGKWGHPVGDLIRRTVRGEALPLAPEGPNRRGLVLLSFFSPSSCLRVSLCVISVLSFCLPSCKDVIREVGEVFLSRSLSN